MLIPAGLMIGAVAWVGIRGWIAKGELESAEQLIGQVDQLVADFDLEAVGDTYDRVADHTATARSLTSDPVWRVFEAFPGAGPNMRAVREIAEVTDDTVGALGQVARFVGGMSPDSLAPVDGAIPIQPLADLAPLITDAAAAMPTLRDRASAIEAGEVLEPVRAARDRVAGLLGRTVEPLATAADLVPLLPSILGADRPRTYVVMFQNNAEARSLGGSALSFSVITMDQGRIALVETVPAALGNFPVFDVSPVPVPDGFDAIFPGAFGQFVANATLRPSFVSAAEIVVQNWIEIRGYAPDGVISVDSVALSYVLRATGPVELSTGDVLSGETAVDLLLNEILLRYNTGDRNADNAAQDAIYSEAVSKVFASIASGAFDMPAMLGAMTQGVGESRIAYWDADPVAEEAIAAAGLGGGLPESTEDSDAIGVFVNDNVGSKLTYYLRAAVNTSSAQCADDRSVHRISIQFESLIPEGATLSPSILGEYEREGLPPAVQRLLVLIYAPPGTTILGANVDGASVVVDPLHDTDRPVGRFVLYLPPGSSTGMAVDLLMGDPGHRDLDLTVTPLVESAPVAGYELDCASVVLPSAG